MTDDPRPSDTEERPLADVLPFRPRPAPPASPPVAPPRDDAMKQQMTLALTELASFAAASQLDGVLVAAVMRDQTQLSRRFFFVPGQGASRLVGEAMMTVQQLVASATVAEAQRARPPEPEPPAVA